MLEPVGLDLHDDLGLVDMQTRAELYQTIGYHQYEALDASIVETIVPQGMPQR